MLVIALKPNLICILAAICVALLIGSVTRIVALRTATADQRSQRLASLGTWWILLLLFVAAVVTGTIGVCLLMASLSILGWREYTDLVTRRRGDHWSVLIIYLLIIVHYGWIATTRPDGIPAVNIVAVALLICCLQLLQGETKNYVRSTAGLLWGAVLIIYALSHAALLTTLDESSNRIAGPIGWFLFLVLLTESNDIGQALIGRRFSKQLRHAITPGVSPGKSWEGFLGGALLTVVLAVCLAPLLTPLNQIPVALVGKGPSTISLFWPIASGLVISVCGFMGDVNMSAVKRDVGVKDSSNFLPGMGGMLDRIDSLTFTAPAFYYLVKWLTP